MKLYARILKKLYNIIKYNQNVYKNVTSRT